MRPHTTHHDDCGCLSAAWERKLEIAADLALERAHGKSLTETERRWWREGWLEQVERRYQEEVSASE